ncbi:MAG: TatD family hydrolase [Tannerellaceae bacterium]|jgi:TatD DNase family protein|nr:TatD family hydrolase [Tannerellaceae bacterium]
MGLVDTHSHVYVEAFDEDRASRLHDAKLSGIEKILLPNIDMQSIDRMHALCDQYPDFTHPMMGLHPTSVKEDYSQQLKSMESCLHKRSYCAIGEIGIDLYWDKSRLREQKIAFEEQLQWSIDLGLPVMIHTRKAFPEVFESIYRIGNERLKGVFHSFSGTEADLREIERLGKFKVGIGGVITYKGAKLPGIIAHTGIDRILLETDSPYLPPVPHRGKRNDPVFIWETARKIAEVYSVTTEEVVRITRDNVFEMFAL